MVVPSGIGPSVWAGTIVPPHAAGCEYSGQRQQGRRRAPAGLRATAGKPDARPVRQRWWRARRRGGTVNTGTGEPRSFATGGPARRRPAPGGRMGSWIAWVVLARLLGL